MLCQPWLIGALSRSLILPTICAHMCSVAFVSAHDSTFKCRPCRPASRVAHISTLPEAGAPFDGFDELDRIEADPLLEDSLDVADIGNRRRRIAVDDDEIGLLSDGNRTNRGVTSEVRGAVQRADADRFERRESGLDEQLDLALIRVAGNDAAATGGIGAGNEPAARASTNARSSAIAFGKSAM